MSERRRALCLLALLGTACPKPAEEGGTSLLVSFTYQRDSDAPPAEYLLLTWVGDGKVYRENERAPASGPLPDAKDLGTFRIFLGEPGTRRIIVARAYIGTELVAEGANETEVKAGTSNGVNVNLFKGRLPDLDDDGIPDGVDNCRTEKNRSQGAVASCQPPPPDDGGAREDAGDDGGGPLDGGPPPDLGLPADARPDTTPPDLGSGKSPRGQPCVTNEECETGRCADSRVGKFCASPGMVVVPAGMFMRGCLAKDTQCAADERPQRSVMVSGFEINQYELTQSEYDACVKAGACPSPSGFNPAGRPNHPVGNVTWAMANTFCTWANKRLPTEAEWEKAARGPGGTIYPWGDEAPKDCSIAQYKACGLADSVGVGQLTGTSGYGIEDLGGNVAEWVSDFYAANYYASAPATDPTGPTSGMHLRRGGGFTSDLPALRTGARVAGDTPAASTGFRCARGL